MTLLFKKRYIEKIVRGEKTATRRKSRPIVKPAGVYRLRTGFFTYLPDRIKVNCLYVQRLGDMTPKDALKEGHSSIDEFCREWTSLYDFWDEDETVWVVEFEYLSQDQNL